MAELLIGEDIGEVWTDLVHLLLEKGKEVSPRGYRTKEILNVSIEVLNGLRNILCSKVRDLNYRFMIAEWLWIGAGLDDVDSLAKYNSVMRNFSDDGVILNGAYGPRLAPQWDYIFENIQKPGSRQAVSTIWSPSPRDSKDIPCTISLQWFLRDGHLHATINMRSSDVWLGLPYDYFTFSQLTNTLASWLNFPVGSITMNLASSHLYETQWEQASHVGNGRYVESPQIPIGVFPGKDSIKRILNLELIEADESIFNQYRLALAVNKNNALEVLRGIAPK